MSHRFEGLERSRPREGLYWSLVLLVAGTRAPAVARHEDITRTPKVQTAHPVFKKTPIKTRGSEK